VTADTAVATAAIIGAILWLAATTMMALRFRSSTGLARSRIQWLACGVVVTATFAIAGAALSLLVDWPNQLWAGLVAGCVVIPVSVVLGRSPRLASFADRVLVQTLVVAGLVGLVGGVYLLVVIGLGRAPEGDERTTLALSVAAAAVACVLAFPARLRLEEWSNQRVYGERHSPDEALRTFGGRMSRAVPMDELLLQLVESLKKTMHLTAAEIWTGNAGDLSRTVSVPERGPARLHLRGEELFVVARAHAQGNAWIQVWAPGLLDGRGERTVRAVSVAHLGDLLGLIVVERRDDDTPFTDEEDRVLVELARQVGLALHNVRLDSALQASLDELKIRNEELVASRARIVAAADESRRQIERNLHDGAQQHLVALAVKIGLVKSLMESDPATATAMLDELRSDAQATLTELREFAHGIYPPLLRDRGLNEALKTAANRASLPTTVDAADVARYEGDVEAAVYFCCLEAMQNAGKHAGAAASIHVGVGNGDGSLWFEVSDDGAGFDVTVVEHGHGFVNMRDRLGAFGGELTVTSVEGAGTTIRGTLPVAALPLPASD
jgi:signal transduction histidine kinase